jgi:hypothetical protein
MLSPLVDVGNPVHIDIDEAADVGWVCTQYPTTNYWIITPSIPSSSGLSASTSTDNSNIKSCVVDTLRKVSSHH